MIEPGCSVLLYTDGLVERRGEVLDEGQGRLADAATAGQHLPPDALVSRLVDGALGSGELGDPSQPDDVALVSVRLLPAPLRARLPAEPAQLRTMRRAVVGWAGEVGLPEEVLEDLQYALGEAAANAVEHAYGREGGEFAYALTYVPGPEAAVAVEVRDEGRWRPAPADPGHRGRGLQVLEVIGKDVQVDRGEGGTTVTFRIPVSPVVATLASVPRAASSREPAGPCVVTSGPPGVRVVGDLDLDGASTVRAGLLDTVVRDVEELAVDLTEVGYASSAGIALLAEMAALAVEREVRLSFRVAPESPLARMLELSGLRAVLPVVPA